MSLVQHSSCCRISPPDFSDAIGLGAVEEHVAMKEYVYSSLLVTTWTQLFLLLFDFEPLRHGGAAYQAEILGTTSGAEMDDIEQMKKIVPLITREIPFHHHVCELVFGVSVTDCILGSKSIQSNNQSRATLWFREKCLIVGLRPLIIILITASLSSMTYNIALEPVFFVLNGM